METKLVLQLTETFEGHAQQTETGVEYWLARDLQQLLGYTKWENFQAVIGKAKTACEVSGHTVANHFPDVRKMVKIGSGTEREIDDLMLTRYACYLIAQNGDPRKPEIAFAQTYFAIQTRRAELIEQRLLEAERVSARKKLTSTEKELSALIFEQSGGNQDFALIRSKGDHALFGKSTQAMKAQWRVPDSRPLADFAPTIILKAKDFAAIAQKHGLTANALQAFVAGIFERMIFDGEHLSDLMAPLELGWKARTQAELALMADLHPLLIKRAGGRNISGLSAYEQ